MSDDTPPSSSNEVAVNDRYPVNKLLAIDELHVQRLFTLLITLFVVGYVAIGLTYSYDARLVPLIVAIPTLLMLVGLLAVQSVPRLRALVDRIESTSLADESLTQETDLEESEELPIETLRMNAVRTLAWILFIFGSVYLFGHVIGLTISLIVIFHYFSELSWVRAIAYALLNVAFLVGLFLFAFNARLSTGVLFG